jgi:hypothetical protein
MRARVLNCFAQLVDDILRGRQIGIAHAKIDDVGARRSRRCLQTVDLFKDIRGQTTDFMEFFRHDPVPVEG